MNTKTILSILSQIETIESQMSVLSDREHGLNADTSEKRELLKRKKKLGKTRGKLIRRLYLD
tara:strand:- start:438 stop:623 length:186 start_codon:yes stop_codon:yes gene_type:complete